MANPLLAEKGGEKLLLLGNEAIVRGAVEAGVSVATTYPGTPMSEIGDTFCSMEKESGIYFEYSTNEKLAFETAYGASLAGVRAIVSFKQYGFNVAADSILPSTYTGVRGGLVLAVGDDPGCYSSVQSEMDSRNCSRLAKLPTLEPSDADECRRFVKLAFEISEKCDIPVMVRLTTKVSHSKSVVQLDGVEPKRPNTGFVKDARKFSLFSPGAVKKHELLIEKLNKAKALVEGAGVNEVYNAGSATTGVVAAGMPFQFVMEALEGHGAKVPVLKLGASYPVPEEALRKFISSLDRVLVVEELDPIMQEEILRIAKDCRPGLKVHGKDLLPLVGEYTTTMVAKAISDAAGFTWRGPEDTIRRYEEARTPDLPVRTPVLCPGCPHRASFYAVKNAVPKETVFGGDIGCYALGILAPLETQDYSIAMGASEGIAHGIAKAADQKVIAFLGDSTFYHAGIEGLINIVQNKSDPLVIVLDNNITAMTGHQPNPASGVNAYGQPSGVGSIEEIARVVGVKNVRVVNPFNQKEMSDAVKEFMAKDGPAVIVSRRECWLLHHRELRRQGRELPRFTIDPDKCNKCGICVHDFGCPAFQIRDDGSFTITELCLGCAACVQICPEKAIHAKVTAR